MNLQIPTRTGDQTQQTVDPSDRPALSAAETYGDFIESGRGATQHDMEMSSMRRPK